MDATQSALADVFITWGQAHEILEARGSKQLATQTITRIVEALFDAQTQHHLDPTLLLAVIEAESNYDQHVRSSKGARGLMQILPGTGKAIARELWIHDPDLHDPVQNIRIGAAYLANLRDSFNGNTALALCAYNVGPARLTRLLKVGKVPRLRYAKRVLDIQREIKKSLEEKADA